MRLTDYFNQGDSADEAVLDKLPSGTHPPFSVTDSMPLITTGGEDSNSATSPETSQQGLQSYRKNLTKLKEAPPPIPPRQHPKRH